MVFTRSMATNKNWDEPRIIALERQVQTLATVVEHLTKQNHDLEEQPCQGMWGLTVTEKSKRAPTLKEGTEKD